jgi:hypothetical protein
MKYLFFVHNRSVLDVIMTRTAVTIFMKVLWPFQHAILLLLTQ